MKKVVVIVVLVVLGAAAWFVTRGRGSDGVEYRFVTVEKGDVERVVTSTGTLGAVTTVEVGTQVSGSISKILADFNDRVTKGQVIAQLDTTLLAIAVSEAKASLAQATATNRYRKREFERLQVLKEQQVVSDSDYNAAQYEAETAAAALQLAKVRLEQAKRNLTYATIHAPISGTVIERDVDVGQTVAASFSAPKLFVIANDLSKMQILVSVDESDIGLIRPGQAVHFTVQAYPDETFPGTVRQVRLQSTISENVVNYTVVVDVDNPSRKLLPGMTATVSFIIETVKDVTKVSNAALRFRPTEAMVAELRKERPEAGAGASDTSRHRPSRPSGRAAGGAQGRGGEAAPANVARLFYIDDSGKLAVARVHTGISDGTYTAIEGRGVGAGMQVIAGVTSKSVAASSNPFEPSRQGRGFRRGPGF